MQSNPYGAMYIKDQDDKNHFQLNHDATIQRDLSTTLGEIKESEIPLIKKKGFGRNSTICFHFEILNNLKSKGKDACCHIYFPM